MTIAFRATLGGTTTDTPASGLQITTNIAAQLGDLVLVCVAKDNSSVTAGLDTTNEVSAIADSRGNGWKKVAEFSKGGGAAGEGVVLAIWSSILGKSMPIGTVIQITTDYVAGKVAGAIAFSLSPNYEAYTPITVASAQTNGAALASLGSGLLTGSIETLFFRAAALELGTRAAPTPTASWTTGMDYYSTTMWLFAEWSIQTATNAASAPTAGGATTDTGSLYPSFRERLPQNVLFFGAPL